MHDSDLADFDSRFTALTGHTPMGWQRRLFRRFLQGSIPSACRIPTGLGKTAAIPIWLVALVCQAERGQPCLPRRLVYVVNRRTVVDQATLLAERIRHRITKPHAEPWASHARTLLRIASVLRSLAVLTDPPLAVSTLRGELADNEEWEADPSRAAIIIGTVDMIGSKLLFRGYGDSRSDRPHHAGLIGYDALFVHDEAHLTPAFSGLLRWIAEEQEREIRLSGQSGALARPIRILELSATLRDGSAADSDQIFTLQDEDYQEAIVQMRVEAEKRLYVHRVESGQLVPEMVQRALAHRGEQRSVVVYVRSPEQAREIDRHLRRELQDTTGERVAVLTGTIRGYERDGLLDHPVVRHLLEGRKPERTIYLVSTSAGEVGIDIDPDDMVSDPTTLDGLIQRLGRVNRRGGAGRRARIDVVMESTGGSRGRAGAIEQAIEQAIETTAGIVRRWAEVSGGSVDVSPRSLDTLIAQLSPEEREQAFSPQREVPQRDSNLLDGWSLTSVQQDVPGLRDVAEFLHGITGEAPDTFVVWRAEVGYLVEALVSEEEVDRSEEELARWFRHCRIDSRERLRDRTDRVARALRRLCERRASMYPNARAIVLDSEGNARIKLLADLHRDESRLAGATVVLPAEIGGLGSSGMLDPEAEGPAQDVAEVNGKRQRWICRTTAEGVEWLRILDGSQTPPGGWRERVRIPLRRPADGDGPEETVEELVLLVPAASNSRSASESLRSHRDAVASFAGELAERLGLPDSVRIALVEAARWHDEGKNHPAWQYYARNEDEGQPLARSTGYRHPAVLGGYRHELESVARARGALKAGADEDLVLHLIASHHGWARPHFDLRAVMQVEGDGGDAILAQVMARFERLQRRFGRWGLAWLESLLRAADRIAAGAHAGGEDE